MEEDLHFLNLEGLDPSQVSQLRDLLHPSNLGSEIEFPWNVNCNDETILKKGNMSSLNVHAPAFETYIPVGNTNIQQVNYVTQLYNNGSSLPDVVPLANVSPYYQPQGLEKKIGSELPAFANGMKPLDHLSYNSYSEPPRLINGNDYQDIHNAQTAATASSFKLNPTVSCFVPQNIKTYIQPEPVVVESPNEAVAPETVKEVNPPVQKVHPEPSPPIHSYSLPESEVAQVPKPSEKLELLNDGVKKSIQSNGTVNDSQTVVTVAPVSSSVATVSNTNAKAVSVDSGKGTSAPAKPVVRSWAQIVRSGQPAAEKVPLAKAIVENGNKVKKNENESENINIKDDKMALLLGKHLHELALDFKTVCLQPRGLINRRNWCYINATLQALLGCSPFYTLIRNLPIGPGVERGKSATPVIDSMVKVTYEFSELPSSQEELQVGQPFQPDFMYDMLRDLKSDCLKGQQEDAEEFLSFILNSMHEEMVTVIKNHEQKNSITSTNDVKENGDQSDGEDEWQVIGSKHKGMVTRKVVEHRTPISDLLGGQIKSFLTTSGNKTSASIQPFFTLQLDIQSDNVNSVSDALKEMTIKEPIQGYTCAKTKQEVEAYSHVALQKLSPVLILHLKRFVYNKNGGCKKVMKKTDYPLELELSRDLFSSDVKKIQRIRTYKLFAVMYHDGEEAIKGHYITDVYNYHCQTWIRCDDRQITAVTEAQVLSHSPPRVPYLLFYQES